MVVDFNLMNIFLKVTKNISNQKKKIVSSITDDNPAFGSLVMYFFAKKSVD